MAKTKEPALRKLGPEEAPELHAAKERADRLSGSVRSAEKNIPYYKDFLDEAQAHIDSKPSEGVLKDWQSRLEHCRDFQIPEEERKLRVDRGLLEKATKALDEERAKVKGLVERGGEFLVPA